MSAKPRKPASKSSAKGAPQAPAQPDAPALIDPVKQRLISRLAPMRNLEPQHLARVLAAFSRGHIREFALLAETVAERDDTLASVKPKREKAIGRRDWQVEPADDSVEAAAHAEILEDFWRNVRTTDAFDRNQKGGLRLLLKQMMTSASFKYAVHHIVWNPQPGKLRATFEHVPLQFFENTTGALRFLKDGTGDNGEDLDPSEWMVTCGDGLMIACLIAASAKRFAMQDWLAFSEKFSMPGVVGKTPAAATSPEGKAMKEAVAAFGQNYAAVLFGADGNSSIDLLQPDGNPSAMPMPALIERNDRKMAALYRGADLSSMSSKDGQGTGASLQTEETDLLEADDCTTCSETLHEVDRIVIAWHLGEDVEPLASIQIQPPARADKTQLQAATKFLVDYGAPVSAQDAANGLGVPLAKDGEDLLKAPVAAPPFGLPASDPSKDPAGPADQKPPAPGKEDNPDPFGKQRAKLANAALTQPQLTQHAAAVRDGLQADLRPLGDALFAAMNAGDGPAMQAALKRISDKAPDYVAANKSVVPLALGIVQALTTPA